MAVATTALVSAAGEAETAAAMAGGADEGTADAGSAGTGRADAARPRAVVTGIGIVAPNGLGKERYWRSVLDGVSGVGVVERFDSGRYPLRVAGEVRDFVPDEHVPSLIQVQTDRWTQFGLACSAEALADAALDPAQLPDYAMSVVTASSSGGTEFGQREIESLWARGPEYVTAYQSIAWFYAATTGQISIRYGLRGPCGVIATEQAGGLDALAQARRVLRGGESAQAVLAGGNDASLSPYGLMSQAESGLLNVTGDPVGAFRPFDAAASGYVPGEGGAMLVVEEAEAAARRGAPQVYGEIAGYAATFDPPPRSDRGPTLGRALRLALADAGVRPDEVDAVFADGMGNRGHDLAEARAIGEVFGERGVPVTLPKTLTGRLYAGGAALDAATALLAMRAGVIPPTFGLADLAPGCAGLDLVLDEPRPAELRTVVVLARGFGGFNAAMVLRAAEAAA